MKNNKFKKYSCVFMALIISGLSIIGKYHMIYAQALPDPTSNFSQVPYLEVLNGNGASNDIVTGLNQINFEMFVNTLASFGIYGGITVYEDMYADYVAELKTNFQNEEWLANNSAWTQGNVYMYDGVPYYANLLADCTVFQIDPKTYELWQGNKTGNIPTPADAWDTASNYAVEIGTKFMESVKAFADKHIVNNAYYKDVSALPDESYNFYGKLSFHSNVYFQEQDFFIGASHRQVFYSSNNDFILSNDCIRYAAVFSDNRLTFYQGSASTSKVLNLPFTCLYYTDGVITSRAPLNTCTFAIFNNNYKANMPIFSDGTSMLNYLKTGKLDGCLNLSEYPKNHIYINPNVAPGIVGGNHYNLGDIKGVNEGIVNAIGQAETGGILNPAIDPATLPTILPGIIPDTPISPLPIVDPKPYIPINPDIPIDPDTPTDPDNPIDPVNSDSWENLSLRDMTTLFPFCIPFDVLSGIKLLNAKPKDPIWVIPIKLDYGGVCILDYTYTLDLTKYEMEKIWSLLRTLEVLGFCLGLGLVTKKFIY